MLLQGLLDLALRLILILRLSMLLLLLLLLLWYWRTRRIEALERARGQTTQRVDKAVGIALGPEIHVDGVQQIQVLDTPVRIPVLELPQRGLAGLAARGTLMPALRARRDAEGHKAWLPRRA